MVLSKSLGPFNFQNYDRAIHYVVSNNGHTGILKNLLQLNLLLNNFNFKLLPTNCLVNQDIQSSLE